MEDQERTVKPKPKLTKAERRELQEKQRAAKSAKFSDGHGSGEPAQANVSPSADSGHPSGQVMLTVLRESLRLRGLAQHSAT